MKASVSGPVLGLEGKLEVLWNDGEHAFCRPSHQRQGDGAKKRFMVIAANSPPSAASLDRLTHEFSLKDHLDAAWALQPLELVREAGRTVLLLSDHPGAETLHRLVGAPMALRRFLRLAEALTRAVRGLHEGGLVHRDINPAHVLVDEAKGQAWLTGFGLASRLPRERQAPSPSGFVASSPAYMSPEQTGRMNRSVDSRSDLYALGVTFYQMLTGALPFAAAEPIEWIHCHVARSPTPPHERLKTIPPPVSHLVMKLLAKMAEDRYQTAAGVEHDLRRCRDQWEAQHRIDDFALAERDVPHRLLVPERLYGRSREVDVLLKAFHAVATTGATELVLVAGYSGVGKSSLVNELQKVAVSPRGLFASGKFDPYRRDIPYATLAQALRPLVQLILGKTEEDLRSWREALCEALGSHGQLVVDLIPELDLIIGPQPPVPDLPAQEAQQRFQTVLRRFIGVFARPEHPLALFLDDLQWLDLAMLDLLESLLSAGDVRHLLLIGAYRDNEVEAVHPLGRRLEAIRRAGSNVRDIIVTPLNRGDLSQMVAEALHCDPGLARPLARLVRDKTAGNPFFAVQFLYALADEGELVFDHEAQRWSWNLDRIRAGRFSDNVLDLMAGKLNLMPDETRAAIRQLAGSGFAATFELLGTVCQVSRRDLHDQLWPAVRAGLVARTHDSYAFQHDRIREAAYSLIAEPERAEVHLQMGRLLLARTPPEGRHEAIFDIVGQFNRASRLISSAEERDQVAHLNLIAGKRARRSAAYSSARTYFGSGRTLLSEDCWSRQYDLAFELELRLAECEFLTGDLMNAETRLARLAERAASLVNRAAVTALRVDLFEFLVRSDRAVAVALEFLGQAGFPWPANPKDEDVRQEYERLVERLEERPIETLVDLPPMRDARARAIIGLLPKLLPAAISTDTRLHRLLIAYMADLSLTYGNTDASCVGYIWLGVILGADFGRHPTALRLGRLSLDLVSKRGLSAFKARVYFPYSVYIGPRIESVRAGLGRLNAALRESAENGDLTYLGFCKINLIVGSLFAGEPLGAIDGEVLEGVEFARNAKSGFLASTLLGFLCFTRACRGLPQDFEDFDGRAFAEDEFSRRLEADPNLALAACGYWIRRLQAAVLMESPSAALEAALKAETLLSTGTAFLDWADYHFYAALARAGCVDAVDAARLDRPSAHLDALKAHLLQLQDWAQTCPQNFENRAALLAAELARFEGRDLEAARLYQLAIHSARANGLAQNEALACELAARFYAARDFEDIAEMYLMRARDGYLRWGADAKVRLLEARHPMLTFSGPRDATRRSASSDQQLDAAAVVKASQALSSEILLPQLIERLMTIALQNAGADRGLLLLEHEGEFHVEAEARAVGEEIVLQHAVSGDSATPESIIRHVTRMHESIILDDATRPNLYSDDPYLQVRRPRSVLCLPLVRQGTLGGLLYLENTVASHVFTPERAKLLELIASQAAISLENTRLYGDLKEREARVRRLIDANIIGIFTWRLDGQITDANDAFLRIVGHSRDDVRAGRIRWSDLMPGEGDRVDHQIANGVRQTGTVAPFEADCVRHGGARVPVLIGAAMFDGTPAEGVAFVLDLSERKHAENLARERERQYHESQVELAHANRVATLGHLSASIAHELSQPLSGVILNAQTAARFLATETPSVAKVQSALTRITRDANRATEVLARVRSLSKRAPPKTDGLAINDVVLETVALTHGEVLKTAVTLRTELGEDLPVIQGDWIQLQQVVLNLIMNALDAIRGADLDRREILILTQRTASGGVQVSVQDSGPGMAPEIMERIFEAFYTTKAHGMGIGLSICRSIIEAHGGRLWASSASPHGAVIQFTLSADAEP